MSNAAFKSVLIAGNALVYAILLFPLLVVVAIPFVSGAGVDFRHRGCHCAGSTTSPTGRSSSAARSTA